METSVQACVDGGKRERNKAENRAAILAAARRVFADLGYDAATIRDIIRSTELAAGTFYNYFRDKESVLRALFDESMAELHRRVRDARDGARSLEEIVRLTYRECFSFLATERSAFDLMRRNAGALRAVLDEPSFLANREDLREAVQHAIDRRGTRSLDADYLTAAINGVAFEVAACAMERQPIDLDGAAAFATELVLGGIPAAARAGAAFRPKKTVRQRTRHRGDGPHKWRDRELRSVP